MNANKILVIEDELNIRENVIELLQLKNYDVQSAANGQEALDLLDSWTPDLIISDIMMPVMDGQELYEIIKESRALCGIPFIFLTANKEPSLRQKTLLDGVDDFISKPFKAQDLLELIKTKIERFNRIKNNQNNLYIGEKKYFLHEVNTPINCIQGFIDILLNDKYSLEKEDIKTFHNAIKTSIERLQRTMRNLLLYENIKNNQFEVSNTDSCDIETVFQKAKATIVKEYDIEDFEITNEIERSYLKISEDNLHFILVELIDNALKFSSNPKNIIVTGQNFNNKHYEINVRDFGIGFTETELKKINAAEQFNREKREQQGLGLGLYLSKTVTKKANGIFSIVSKKNEGTTISIILPLH
jgi:two-component system sensor histidine kinase/response regulator